jgi:hypothetical protein
MLLSGQIIRRVKKLITTKQLESRRKFWKNEVLNYSELKKDERVGGLVFIPVNPQVKYLRVVVPIGNADFQFYFKQVRID